MYISRTYSITVIQAIAIGLFMVSGISSAAQKSKTGSALTLAALTKSPAAKFNRDGKDQESDTYLVNRPKKGVNNYVNVVLKALVKDIDITLDRPKLIAKLKKATPGQQALFAVTVLRSEVQFGGFKSYLSKNASNLLPEAREGLEKIGAFSYLKLLNDTLMLFVDDEYMLDTALDRKNHLATIPRNEAFRVFEKADAGFEGLENESMLNEYMNNYINKHPKEFFK